MEAPQHTVINRDDLPHDDNPFEFEGFRFPATEVSFIWVNLHISRQFITDWLED